MKGSFWTELEMIDRGGWELLFHIFPLKFSLHHSVLFIMNTRWCSLNPNADSCQSWQSSPDPRHSNLFFKGIKSVESVRPALLLLLCLAERWLQFCLCSQVDMTVADDQYSKAAYWAWASFPVAQFPSLLKLRRFVSWMFLGLQRSSSHWYLLGLDNYIRTFD